MVSQLPVASNVPELTQLHDIHLPSQIGLWPLAPGWYLLGFCIGVLSVSAWIWGWRYYIRGRAKRQAVKLLVHYQQEYQRYQNSQRTSMQISTLLRRVAMAYFPRKQVAGLSGEDWIAFLNQTSARDVNFNLVRTALLEYPYQPSQNVDLSLLFNLVRKWIKRRGKECLN